MSLRRKTTSVVFGVGILSALLVGLFFGTTFTAADTQPNAINPSQPAVAEKPGLDVKLSLELTPTMRRHSRTSYSTLASLKNQSAEEFVGPIYLVIEKTTPELRVENADHMTPAKEPAFLLLADGEKLKPRMTTQPRRLAFQSAKPLTLAERKSLELDYRLERSLAIEIASTQKWDRVPQRPNAALLDKEPSLAEARRNSGRPEKLMPVPELAKAAEARFKKQKVRGFDDPEVQRVVKIQNRWMDKLRKVEGLRAVGTGIDEEGNIVIVTQLQRAGIRNDIPGDLEGVPVKYQVTGKPKLRRPPEPQDKLGQAGRPLFNPNAIQMGTNNCFDDPTDKRRPCFMGSSVGHFAITAGTAGALVCDDSGIQYVLSNNHVIANSVELFQFPPAAFRGDLIFQPGPVDMGDGMGTTIIIPSCAFAILTDFEPFDLRPTSFNLFDAAIGRLIERNSMLAQTPCYGYGVPRSETVEPALGQKVAMSGRTFFFKTGFIDIINFFIADFGQGNFVNQFQVAGTLTPFPSPPLDPLPPSCDPFSCGGDSGSLIVTYPSKNPVGILFAGFAGNDGRTFCCPINPVLDRFGVKIVGTND